MSGGTASLQLQSDMARAVLQRVLPAYDRIAVALCHRVPGVNAAPSQIYELSGGGYARVLTTLSPSWWSLDPDGTVYCNRTLAFPFATAAWGYVPGWALLSAKSSGSWTATTLATGRLLEPVKIPTGDRIVLPPRAISFDFVDAA